MQKGGTSSSCVRRPTCTTGRCPSSNDARTVLVLRGSRTSRAGSVSALSERSTTFDGQSVRSKCRCHEGIHTATRTNAVLITVHLCYGGVQRLRSVLLRHGSERDRSAIRAIETLMNGRDVGRGATYVYGRSGLQVRLINRIEVRKSMRFCYCRVGCELHKVVTARSAGHCLRVCCGWTPP